MNLIQLNRSLPLKFLYRVSTPNRVSGRSVASSSKGASGDAKTKTPPQPPASSPTAQTPPASDAQQMSPPQCAQPCFPQCSFYCPPPAPSCCGTPPPPMFPQSNNAFMGAMPANCAVPKWYPSGDPSAAGAPPPCPSGPPQPLQPPCPGWCGSACCCPTCSGARMGCPCPCCGGIHTSAGMCDEQKIGVVPNPTYYDSRKYGHELSSNHDDVTKPPFETLPEIPTGIFRNTKDEVLGPRASKCADYKVPEYFAFHHMSFYDIHLHLRRYRQPCANAKRKP